MTCRIVAPRYLARDRNDWIVIVTNLSGQRLKIGREVVAVRAGAERAALAGWIEIYDTEAG